MPIVVLAALALLALGVASVAAAHEIQDEVPRTAVVSAFGMMFPRSLAHARRTLWTVMSRRGARESGPSAVRSSAPQARAVAT